MDCWRRKSASANGNGHPDIDAGRRLELPVLMEPVERRETSNGHCHGLHQQDAHEEPVVRRTRGIGPRKKCFAFSHIDLVLQIIMWDFSLRPCHRRRDRSAHRVKVDADGALSFNGRAPRPRLSCAQYRQRQSRHRDRCRRWRSDRCHALMPAVVLRARPDAAERREGHGELRLGRSALARLA